MKFSTVSQQGGDVTGSCHEGSLGGNEVLIHTLPVSSCRRTRLDLESRIDTSPLEMETLKRSPNLPLQTVRAPSPHAAQRPR